MKKAYFLADLHLGSSSPAETREAERELLAFLDSAAPDMGELYLLGDILDYWFEYKHVVPRGFVRFFGKLAELSDRGVKIEWIIGNHDIWIFDYLPQELGVNVVDGILETEVMGERFSMQHGDAIGGSAKFRFIRSMFRNRLCQKLYAAIHPGLTVGFAGWCSSRSRKSSHSKNDDIDKSIKIYKEWCEKRIDAGDSAAYFVFGHIHQECQVSLTENRKMVVLPCWKMEKRFGAFDGTNFEIKGLK